MRTEDQGLIHRTSWLYPTDPKSEDKNYQFWTNFKKKEVFLITESDVLSLKKKSIILIISIVFPACASRNFGHNWNENHFQSCPTMGISDMYFIAKNLAKVFCFQLIFIHLFWIFKKNIFHVIVSETNLPLLHRDWPWWSGWLPAWLGHPVPCLWLQWHHSSIQTCAECWQHWSRLCPVIINKGGLSQSFFVKLHVIVWIF